MARIHPRLLAALLAGTALAGPAAWAVELPHGGSVAYGGVTIGNPSATQLTIQQSTPTAIVNWQGFSIGQGGRVDISQPSSSSAILNRVSGNTPSTIAGQLNANGQVYLVNPNGIAITPTGTVKAGAFVASSLDIADEDFKAGRRTFRGTGASAAVSNAGTIEIGRGGYAALLGGQVENSGTISVPMGRVGLGAAEQATLDLSGDGFLQVAVPSKSTSAEALVRQSGRITARGGLVELRAATARDAARNAINLSGIVEATSVGGRSGAIVLGGGEGGRVAVTGRLDASARTARSWGGKTRQARGGSITVTGDAVDLAGATLKADGPDGGGRIRIGGDYQGGGTLQRARTTSIDAATTITADANVSGNGGNVVIWSDQMTAFAGRISAKGGPLGGNGGDAEVSGKAVLGYTGETNLTAPRGRFGNLLLDPFNVFITNGADTSGFTAGANDSVINAGTLSNALNQANVTVTTGGAGSPGAQAGDIAVQANVGWAAATTLTLSAFGNIIVGESPVSNNVVAINVPTGGGLTLRADNSGTGNGTVAFYNTGPGGGLVNAAPGSTVSIFYNPASNPAGSGVNPTSYTAPTNYAIGGGQGGVSGGGTLIASMLVNTAADLQNMRNNLAGAYALGRDIDASGAAAFNGGAGFASVGDATTPFTGRLNGLGQTVSNLRIVSASNNGTGLFGGANGAVLANINLAGLSVAGGDNTGGLVGTATGAAIAGGSVSGVVTGANSTGGVVGGTTNGTISGTTAAVTVTGTDNVGGLVGATDGTAITRTAASGNVSGGSQVGGLVGLALSSTITQSSASGAVAGTDLVGGLVGAIGGEGASLGTAAITQSFATGAVTSAGRGGGLAGLVSNATQITDSYASGPVSGGTFAGGLIGEINSVPAGNPGPATITNTYATGFLSGAGARGGLVGNVVGALQTVGTSYWDTQTTGVTTSAGGFGTGLTTAQLQGTLPPGFVAGTWGTQANAYPYLTWRYPNGVLAISGFARDANGATLAGEPVRVAAGGVVSPRTASGANGYYYVARDPLTGAAPQGATAFLDGANRGSASIDAPIGAGSITNLDPRTGRVVVTSALPTTSGIATMLANAGDSTLSPNIPYTIVGGVPTFGGLPTFIESTSPSGLTVDRSVISGGPLQIAGAGSGTGALTSAGPFTIAPGQFVQSQNGDVVIATTQFINQGGPTAVRAGGRFLIYSLDYDADQRGGLDGGLLFSQTFAANAPGTIGGTGGQFIYARAAPVPPVTPPVTPPTTPPTTGVDALTLALTFPTLVRQLPPTFVPVADPPDTIEVGGGGLGVPILGQDQRSAGLSGDEMLAYLDEAGRTLDAETARCEEGGGSRRVAAYNDCVATALETYAAKLEARIAQLPPSLRNIAVGTLPRALRGTVAGRPTLRSVPDVIRAAARQVRASRTVAQARNVVRAAVTVVRKAIALIRADEPAVAARQVRHGNAIAGALQMVENRLSRAVGL